MAEGNQLETGSAEWWFCWKVGGGGVIYELGLLDLRLTVISKKKFQALAGWLSWSVVPVHQKFVGLISS